MPELYKNEVPVQYKDKFKKELGKHNNERMMHMALMVVLAEIFLFLIKIPSFNTFIQTPLYTFGAVKIVLSILFFLIFRDMHNHKKYSEFTNVFYLVSFFVLQLILYFYALHSGHSDLNYALFIILFSVVPILRYKHYFYYAMPFLLVSIYITYTSASSIALELICNHILYYAIGTFISLKHYQNYVNMYVTREELIDSKEQFEETILRLEELYITDELTSILNRRGMMNAIDVSLSYYSREKKPISLLMADIDFFKAFNDTYGHLAGDNTLVQVAQCMKASCKRKTDIVARYGGEEFVVFCNCDKEGAIILARTIMENIYNLNIPHEKSQHRNVTVSIGIVSVVANDYTTIDSLIQSADSALYAAKNSGRNTYKVAD